jgi:hypothetical protein
MSDPHEWPPDRLKIILIFLALIAAASLTIEGVYLVLNQFALHDQKDPLTKAGGLSPAQKADGK